MERKKRVLIVGLLGEQINQVKSRCANIEMRFWKTDENLAKLKTMVGSTDHVISLTNFINHATDTMIKNNTHCYTRVSGGISKVCSVLLTL